MSECQWIINVAKRCTPYYPTYPSSFVGWLVNDRRCLTTSVRIFDRPCHRHTLSMSGSQCVRELLMSHPAELPHIYCPHEKMPRSDISSTYVSLACYIVRICRTASVNTLLHQHQLSEVVRSTPGKLATCHREALLSPPKRQGPQCQRSLLGA